MQFNYGIPIGYGTSYAGYAPYSYTVTRRAPRIEILPDASPSPRPFEKQDSLVDLITGTEAVVRSDPYELSEGRAHTQWLQMNALLKHLDARHTIHHQIKTVIEYNEAGIRSRLDEMKSGTAYRGQSGKFESDLLKQLDRLSSESRAEDVACWRDTGRMLSDICDRWTEYADQTRKTRMMNFDL